MYSLRYARSFNFGIIEKFSLHHVFEDKFIAEDNLFCIADGVTRDFLDDTPLIYPKTVEEAKEIIDKYPNPSGSAYVAQLCVDTITNCIKKASIFSRKTFEEAIKKTNEEIKKINDNKNIDFLHNDYYSCVTVGGVITKNFLNCFSIGDSEIKALDKDFNVLFDSTSKTNENPGFIYRILEKLNKNWNWNNKNCRKFYRKHIRNNLWLKFTNRLNVGVLTGQKSSLQFLNTYKIPLKNVKYILAYSDGCAELLQTKDQISQVIANPDSIRFGTCEKTLIIYEKID